jgi:hypothetical protein
MSCMATPSSLMADQLPPCRYCGKPHIPGSPLPLEDLPWRDIITLERRWLEKQYRKHRCCICDAPMVCGQTGSHITCQRLLSALGS